MPGATVSAFREPVVMNNLSEVTDPEALELILTQLGYEVSIAIDRVIVQYDIGGAMIRFDHYPRMDDLV